MSEFNGAPRTAMEWPTESWAVQPPGLLVKALETPCPRRSRNGGNAELEPETAGHGPARGWGPTSGRLQLPVAATQPPGDLLWGPVAGRWAVPAAPGPHGGIHLEPIPSAQQNQGSANCDFKTYLWKEVGMKDPSKYLPLAAACQLPGRGVGCSLLWRAGGVAAAVGQPAGPAAGGRTALRGAL